MPELLHHVIRFLAVALGVGLGVFLGLSIGLALGMAWNLLGPATAEWFCETFLDHQRVEEDERESPAREVLVSDLHIDTWDYAPQTPQRAINFVDFLNVVRGHSTIEGFILNGDLMDIPMFAGKLDAMQNRMMLEVNPGPIAPDQGVIGLKYVTVLQQLFGLRRPAPDGKFISRTIFQTGNHDIGVVGLRYVMEAIPDFLPGVQAGWSPQVLLMGTPGGISYDKRLVYVEHGQEYDPFLWLYLRYAVLDLLRGGHLRREAHFIEAQQRRGMTGFGRSSKGSVQKARIRAEADVNQSIPANMPVETAPTPRKPGLHWDFAGDQHTWGERLIMLRYRWAARMAFKLLPASKRDKVKTVTFGHTHKPDRYVFPDGRVYFNSGDWCGNTTHQCYSLVHENGFVSGPFQWENALTFHDRHGS